MMGMGVIAVIGWSVDRYFFGTLERATLQEVGHAVPFGLGGVLQAHAVMNHGLYVLRDTGAGR
jgi:hypothetical protein